ncbi:hypothetical protein HPB50_010690 [Hyalomma asiaticum]|uniref:Uncharacterized protein n=1 Tax=Hyalomma asiaticum TaxID=266040 RepID=A0ACB7SG84_HYAAI|nr:hypothetical protein HPB50_010690 [Hyalomma asiaticum]
MNRVSVKDERVNRRGPYGTTARRWNAADPSVRALLFVSGGDVRNNGGSALVGAVSTPRRRREITSCPDTQFNRARSTLMTLGSSVTAASGWPWV